MAHCPSLKWRQRNVKIHLQTVNAEMKSWGVNGSPGISFSCVMFHEWSIPAGCDVQSDPLMSKIFKVNISFYTKTSVLTGRWVQTPTLWAVPVKFIAPANHWSTQQLCFCPCDHWTKCVATDFYQKVVRWSNLIEYSFKKFASKPENSVWIFLIIRSVGRTCQLFTATRKIMQDVVC